MKIFDTITKSYLGDSEVIYNPNSGNNFVIKQLSISGDNTISIRQYSFNANGTYERKAIAWGGVIKEPDKMSVEEIAMLYEIVSYGIDNKIPLHFAIEHANGQQEIVQFVNKTTSGINIRCGRTDLTQNLLIAVNFNISNAYKVTRTNKNYKLGE